MSTTYVFGYASLVGRSGVNGRGMRHFYRNRDFQEVILNGYRRELNATIRGYDAEMDWAWSSRYFGITKQPGHQTNGVIFPIAPRDIAPFVMSEGGDRLYHFINVTPDMLFPKGSPLKDGDRVYTCVVRRPDKTGLVTERYLEKCRRALSSRSPAFVAAFGALDSYL